MLGTVDFSQPGPGETENKGGNSWWVLVEELFWALGNYRLCRTIKTELGGSGATLRSEVKCGDL